MSDITQSLNRAMEIEGAVAVALVDHKSGITLGTQGGGGKINLELAAAGTTNVLRSKLKVMKDLNIDESIDDILITLDSQYHLIKLMRKYPELFLYAVIDMNGGNLGLARHKLVAIEKDLEL